MESTVPLSSYGSHVCSLLADVEEPCCPSGFPLGIRNKHMVPLAASASGSWSQSCQGLAV